MRLYRPLRLVQLSFALGDGFVTLIFTNVLVQELMSPLLYAIHFCTITMSFFYSLLCLRYKRFTG